MQGYGRQRDRPQLAMLQFSANYAAKNPNEEQQNDRADRGADDLPRDASDRENVRQKHSGYNRAENANDDVSDKAETSARIDKTCEPARDGPNSKQNDDSNRTHGPLHFDSYLESLRLGGVTING
jgi:hypothetical protein